MKYFLLLIMLVGQCCWALPLALAPSVLICQAVSVRGSASFKDGSSLDYEIVRRKDGCFEMMANNDTVSGWFAGWKSSNLAAAGTSPSSTFSVTWYPSMYSSLISLPDSPAAINGTPSQAKMLAGNSYSFVLAEDVLSAGPAVLSRQFRTLSSAHTLNNFQVTAAMTFINNATLS